MIDGREAGWRNIISSVSGFIAGSGLVSNLTIEKRWKGDGEEVRLFYKL